MRRVGLAFWLLRVVLPTIVAYWSVRAARALLSQFDSLRELRLDDDPVIALIRAVGWSNAASTILLVLIILEALRLLAR
jgi:hypothetical protein